MTRSSTIPRLPAVRDLTVDQALAWYAALPSKSRPGQHGGAAPAAADPMAPTSWSAFIGQEPVVTDLQVRARAAKARCSAMASTLVVACPGSGKSTLARLVAVELGRPLVELKKPVDTPRLARMLADAGPMPVLHVDEVHLWPRGTGQHDLMQLIEDGQLEAAGRTYRLPDVTVLASTTNPEALVGPLVDRMAARPVFVPYTTLDMELIVSGMALRAGLDLDIVTRTYQATLGAAAAGSPRAARRLVQATLDLHDAGQPCDDLATLRFAGVEPDGMTRNHLAYLSALTGATRPVGESALARMIGLPIAMIRDLEDLLLARGLIVLTGRGRQITAAGAARVP